MDVLNIATTIYDMPHLSWGIIPWKKGDRFIFCPTLRLSRSGFGWLRRNQGWSGHVLA